MWNITLDAAGCPAGDSGSSFFLGDLKELLLADFGPSLARKLQWSLTPFEYLARRRGGDTGRQAQLIVDQPIPVSALLPHIDFVLQYCSKLIQDNSSPATAQEAARKAAKFTARLLFVLGAPSVQQRLGGPQQLQPYLSKLQAALPTFQQQSGHQKSPTGGAAGSRGSPAAAAAAQPAAGAEDPFASAFASGPTAAAAAAAAAGGHNRAARPCSIKGSSGMHLAALLAAIAPFSAGQPGAPFPPDFSALLTVWARLVYGEAGIADLRSVHVSALMLYHWRSLLRYLRLCLQGAAALGSTGSTGGSSSACPMPVSAASGLIQGLLHLLQHDSVRSQFTQEQYARVTNRFQAFIAVLQGLPLTPTGHAAAVGNFSSSAVAAVMEAVQTVCSSGLTPAEPSSVLAITTALSLGASAGSSDPSMSQQQLLSMVRSSLVNTGMLSKQELEAVQGVLEVLRRQVVGGSNQYEVGGGVLCCRK